MGKQVGGLGMRVVRHDLHGIEQFGDSLLFAHRSGDRTRMVRQYLRDREFVVGAVHLVDEHHHGFSLASE